MGAIKGHGLSGEGHDVHREDGSRIRYPEYRNGSRIGCARCSCGELSPLLSSDNQRKKWHRDVHKPAVLLAQSSEADHA